MHRKALKEKQYFAFRNSPFTRQHSQFYLKSGTEMVDRQICFCVSEVFLKGHDSMNKFAQRKGITDSVQRYLCYWITISKQQDMLCTNAGF